MTTGHERISTLTSATALTAGTYDKADTTHLEYSGVKHPVGAEITVEAADIRYTADGTTPTVTVGTGLGHLKTPGETIYLVSYDEIVAFRAINAVGSSGAAIVVTYKYDR
jgi:hypothetical protein